ncbi:zinc finger, RING-CH-type containing protein [Tanacetum coccineum]|uniref:Zinc finger, RING-CH-type containing protein n=1 Tax=Tanacetum coccineum TaxID=301880 RepID=A0ABQ5G741_9ASTR
MAENWLHWGLDDDLISPCTCKGTQQFVHRACLDHWRSVKEGFAFSHCTTCKAQFHLQVVELKHNSWRTIKFRLFVARDVFLVFLAVQTVIGLMGGLAYIADKNGSFRTSFDDSLDRILSTHPLPLYYSIVMIPFQQRTTKMTEEDKKKRLSTYVPVCPFESLPLKLRGSIRWLSYVNLTVDRLMEIVPSLPNSTSKGMGKHPRVLAHYLENSKASLDPLVPEAYYAHNVLSGLHCPSLKNRLDSLSLDDLANVYDILALYVAIVGNMLTNESRVVSRDYSKLKDDFVSLRSKNRLLEHEMSKLEDSLSKARKNQDVEGSQVFKDLRSKNAQVSKEPSMLREVATSMEDSWKKLFEDLDRLRPSAEKVKRLGKRCQDLEAERGSLLSKESSLYEEVSVLSSKLKITDLERTELVRDFLLLDVEKLFSS